MLTDETRSIDFPTLEGMVYLNSAAEGIPPTSVGESLRQYFTDKLLGMDGRDPHFAELDAAKALVAEFYGLTPSEVAICSCSSEAFNLAAMALKMSPGDEVIVSDLDFPSGATPWLQADNPATVKVWKSREGALHVEDLVALLSEKTKLVSTSLVSFYNGFMIPLQEVAAAIRKHSASLFALDVTQALGRIPLNLTDVDLIVSSTHKWILASHGGGLVGVPRQREREWTVPAGGWYNLKDAFGPDRFERAVSLPGAASFAVGMPNFPAIYAIRAGLKYIRDVGVSKIHLATKPLVEHCQKGLSELNLDMLSPRDPEMLAGILAFRHPKADELAKQLREKNIHIMSHAGRLRVSLHGYNTHSDVERFLGELRTFSG